MDLNRKSEKVMEDPENFQLLALLVPLFELLQTKF